MPSSTCSGEDVLGASYPTTSSCPDRPPTITSERGAWMAPGSRYMPSCAKGCVAWLAESLLPAPPSSTPKRSRLPREVVLAVTTVARQMSSRKRHLLVDTSGLVLNAVVHPADVADRDGARLVLAPSASRRIGFPDSSTYGRMRDTVGRAYESGSLSGWAYRWRSCSAGAGGCGFPTTSSPNPFRRVLR